MIWNWPRFTTGSVWFRGVMLASAQRWGLAVGKKCIGLFDLDEKGRLDYDSPKEGVLIGLDWGKWRTAMREWVG